MHLAMQLQVCNLRRYHYQIWQDTANGKQRMERGTTDLPDLETVIEDQNQVSSCMQSDAFLEPDDYLGDSMPMSAKLLSSHPIPAHARSCCCPQRASALPSRARRTRCTRSSSTRRRSSARSSRWTAAAGPRCISSARRRPDAIRQGHDGTAMARRLRQWGGKPDLTYVRPCQDSALGLLSEIGNNRMGIYDVLGLGADECPDFLTSGAARGDARTVAVWR